MATKILFLHKYDQQAAAFRYRFSQYFPTLQAEGIEITSQSLFDDAYLKDRFSKKMPPFIKVLKAYGRRLKYLFSAKDFDLVVLYMEALPYLPFWLESLLLLKKTPYVVDLDDAIYLRPLAFGKFKKIFSKAQRVFAGNPTLASYALKYNRDVVVLPTVVDLNYYSQVKKFDLERSTITIGWVGSPSTARSLAHIQNALRTVTKKYNCKLVLVGSGSISMDLPNLEIRPWVLKNEIVDILQMDVGIMPLENDAWSQGKCGFKLIQYMACGLPVVASPVGVNQEIVQHNKNGFLANSEEEWVYALSQLIESPPLLAKMGRQGRELVEQKYCLQVTQSVFLENVKQCLRLRKST